MSKIDIEFIRKDGQGDVARAQRIIDREVDALKRQLAEEG